MSLKPTETSTEIRTPEPEKSCAHCARLSAWQSLLSSPAPIRHHGETICSAVTGVQGRFGPGTGWGSDTADSFVSDGLPRNHLPGKTSPCASVPTTEAGLGH